MAKYYDSDEYRDDDEYTEYDAGEDDHDDADGYGDDQDDDDQDDDVTVPCHYCRKPVYEDAERCPYCEQYLSQIDSPPARRPWWFWVGIIVCFYIVYRWISG